MKTFLEFEGERYELKPVDNHVSKLTFYDFWRVYPKRLGPNPRALAQKKWLALVKSGVDPAAIINGAKAYSDEMRSLNQFGTPFVCHASTWLNQRRFEDYTVDPGSAGREAKIDADMAARGYKWNVDRWEKI